MGANLTYKDLKQVGKPASMNDLTSIEYWDGRLEACNAWFKKQPDSFIERAEESPQYKAMLDIIHNLNVLHSIRERASKL